VALWLAFTLRAAAAARELALRGCAALVMGLAITGMHYTAMAAAIFDPASICTASGSFDVDNQQLAHGIAVVILGVLALSTVLSVRSVAARVRQAAGGG
jgi:NO-binding membrane sensor protein with MHYT domain